MGSVLSTLNSLVNQLTAIFRQQQERPKELNLNSLPDKVVVDIFSRMTPTELLATERVDRNWQRLVRETLEGRVETVVLEELYRANFIWNSCRHFKNDEKMISLHKMLYYIFTEKQKIMEEALGREYHHFSFDESLQSSRGMQLFTSCLFKLSNVRCIESLTIEISFLTLIQSFEACPKLECITLNGYKLVRSREMKDDLSYFVRTFGHRLVHLFGIYCDHSKYLQRFLQLLGKTSNNLELTSLNFNDLTEKIVTKIKPLQQPDKNTRVMIKFRKFTTSTVTTPLDFIDVLEADELHWNLLLNNCQRLSSLRFQTLQLNSDSPNQFKSIEFLNLKHLHFIVTVSNLQFLIHCQFPNLKKLDLGFEHKVQFLETIDPLFEQLFDKTPLLNQINIYYSSEIQCQVPGPSLMRLTNLTELFCYVWFRSNWDVQMIVDCFDVISQMTTLKKFELDYEPYEKDDDQWQAVINEQLATLKKRRPDLAIELVLMGPVLSTLNSLFNQMFESLRQEQPKEVHLNSLPAKVVVDIFSRMTPTELLATERVDRNWQRLVRETLEKNIETVRMGRWFREKYIWSRCHHLKNNRKTMSLYKIFDYIFDEKKRKMEDALAREYEDIYSYEGLRTPQDVKLLTISLSKLGGVRSIDLTKFKISVQTLVRVFEACPKLECITIQGQFSNQTFDDNIPFLDMYNTLNEDDWIQFINSFGHRLVHLVVHDFLNCKRLFNLLGNYSNKLLYLELIGFGIGPERTIEEMVLTLTKEIVTTIQQLQQTKSVYVMVVFKETNEPVSLELIDEIICLHFHWNSLPDHCQRLSLLQFESFNQYLNSADAFKSIDFMELKTLVIDRFTNLELQVLINSQFLVLENLKLTIFNHIDNLDLILGLLFEKMPNLVKLNIQYHNEFQQQVPGPSILQLKSLNEVICHVVLEPNWDLQVMVDSFEVLGQVASLKKLSLEFYLDHLWHGLQDEWRSAIRQQSAALRNQRPELVVKLEFLHEMFD